MLHIEGQRCLFVAEFSKFVLLTMKQISAIKYTCSSTPV